VPKSRVKAKLSEVVSKLSLSASTTVSLRSVLVNEGAIALAITTKLGKPSSNAMTTLAGSKTRRGSRAVDFTSGKRTNSLLLAQLSVVI
jgi:hypothetical protein